MLYPLWPVSLPGDPLTVTVECNTNSDSGGRGADNYNVITAISLHCTTLHYTTLYYTALHFIALHCTSLHFSALQYTGLHYIVPPVELWARPSEVTLLGHSPGMALSTLYTVHCSLYTVRCTLFIVHCWLYTLHWTLYTFIAHCTVNTVDCLLYNTNYTLYPAHCTQSSIAFNFLAFETWSC